MKGFVAGTLALIALEVLVTRSNAAKAALTGSNALINMFKRALSPTVAGVPDRRGR